MRKRILDAWRVLTGDMKAVPKGANVIYGYTFTTAASSPPSVTWKWTNAG